MGDWYVGESFSYIKVYGSNASHMLPKVVLDRLVLEEISFKQLQRGFTKNVLHLKGKFGLSFLLPLDP